MTCLGARHYLGLVYCNNFHRDHGDEFVRNSSSNQRPTKLRIEIHINLGSNKNGKGLVLAPGLKEGRNITPCRFRPIKESAILRQLACRSGAAKANGSSWEKGRHPCSCSPTRLTSLSSWHGNTPG